MFVSDKKHYDLSPQTALGVGVRCFKVSLRMKDTKLYRRCISVASHAIQTIDTEVGHLFVGTIGYLRALLWYIMEGLMKKDRGEDLIMK